MDNVTVDFIHDIFLGICRYDLPLLLNHYIDDGLPNLSEMNFRTLNCDYGQQKSNKPPKIEQLQLTKERINLYASEIITLMIKLPLIIGDLIPKQNKE